MTAEQIEELLGKVTQGEWAITGQPDKVCAEGYTKQGAAKVIVEVREKAWMQASEQFANATLISLAPSFARRVIAAEKLVKATDDLLNDIFGGKECVDISDAEDALTAYREASK